MKLTKSTLQQIIREEVTKIVSSDAILEFDMSGTASAGPDNPGAVAGDCPPGRKFVSGEGCVEPPPPGNREEWENYSEEEERVAKLLMQVKELGYSEEDLLRIWRGEKAAERKPKTPIHVYSGTNRGFRV